MKKVISSGILLVIILFSVTFVFAATIECAPTIQLLSQDPYPAIPGDYVKLVFQIGDISDSACGDISLELVNKYPISFDPGQESKISLKSGTYIKDYSTHKIVAFKVRVDSDAVDGDNPIEILLSKGTSVGIESKQFNLNVEDTRADFEVYVKNLDFTTNVLTLEVLNIAEVDVKSIAVEILDSSDLTVKGAKTKIIGDLDSNEYTSADFEIVPEDTSVPLRLYYTDNVGFRRSIEKTVTIQTEYFQNRKADEKSTPLTSYIVLAVVVLGIGYWLYKRKKAKDAKKR
jgi:hypothetical protein